VKRDAIKAFRLFQQNPHHPGLQFKKIESTGNMYSARVNIGCRALAVLEDDTAVWFWIGSHADYDRLI
jgi:hypothetical protein